MDTVKFIEFISTMYCSVRELGVGTEKHDISAPKNFDTATPPIQSESLIYLTDTGESLTDGATVPLRDRSIADSCHLIGQAVSLPTARIGQEKVMIIPNVLIVTNIFIGFKKPVFHYLR
ncbi:hypothetical protein TNCV_2875801 [Trichonephila clavipes]|nr:hypothetical protein TNCV_2875801 [Trichonephila clavipes]